jgi:carbon storage regulator CsrA
MLVLTRNVGEAIVVEIAGMEAITITMVETRGKHGRIGVEAPRAYKIWRKEAYDIELQKRYDAESRAQLESLDAAMHELKEREG